MSIPGVQVTFREKASTFITRSKKGAAGLIVKDDGATPGAYILTKESEIPKGLSEENAAYIKRAFIGGSEMPQRVIIYVLETADERGLEPALTYFEAAPVAYIAGSVGCDSEEAKEIGDWVQTRREDGKGVRAVLPNYAGDNPGIINLTASGIEENGKACETSAYCSRIVGLLCGTPMTESITYKELPEVTAVSYLSKAEMESKIREGELLLFTDGESARVLSGVTSLKTKGTFPDGFRKIKIVEIADMISKDIQKTARTSYLGRLSNSYDNKCVLMTAIKTYLTGLEREGLLEVGTSDVDIDLEAQTAYLKETGISTVDMTEEEIKKAPTGDSVFLAVTIRPLDAIENIVVLITM